MHGPHAPDLEEMYQILRYLKITPGQGILYNTKRIYAGIQMMIEQNILIEGLHLNIVPFFFRVVGGGEERWIGYMDKQEIIIKVKCSRRV